MTRKRPEKTRKIFEEIAARHLGIETLTTRRSDSLDFHDVAVWCVKAALEEAYEAGRRDATKQLNRKRQGD